MSKNRDSLGKINISAKLLTIVIRSSTGSMAKIAIPIAGSSKIAIRIVTPCVGDYSPLSRDRSAAYGGDVRIRQVSCLLP
jgi:hypothetical protein